VPFDLKRIRVIYYDLTDPFRGTKLPAMAAGIIISAFQNPGGRSSRARASETSGLA